MARIHKMVKIVKTAYMCISEVVNVFTVQCHSRRRQSLWKRGQNKNASILGGANRRHRKQLQIRQNRHLFDFTPYFCGVHQRTADEIYVQFATRFAHTTSHTHTCSHAQCTIIQKRLSSCCFLPFFHISMPWFCLPFHFCCVCFILQSHLGSD